MVNKESNFASAVIYLNGKNNNLFSFLEMISKVFQSNFKKYEIICVNDSENESEIEAIKKFKEQNGSISVSVITMGFTHGLEASMNAGIDLAIGDFVFEFDNCYVDYEESMIMEIYHKALEGYDIVSAVPPKSKISSKFFYSIYNRFSESDYDIKTERFRVISRRAINRTSSFSKTIPYRKAVYASSGLKVKSIQYKTIAEPSGLLCSDSEKGNTAMDAVVIFTNLAYKVSLCVSMIMAMFMIITGIYTVVMYFGQNKPVAGWAPLMGLISIGFLAVFVVLTIIIKYLDVLLKIVFKKQKYLISSIEKY